MTSLRKPAEMTRRFQLNLSPADAGWLAAESNRLGTSAASILRGMLRQKRAEQERNWSDRVDYEQSKADMVVERPEWLRGRSRANDGQ